MTLKQWMDDRGLTAAWVCGELAAQGVYITARAVWALRTVKGRRPGPDRMAAISRMTAGAVGAEDWVPAKTEGVTRGK